MSFYDFQCEIPRDREYDVLVAGGGPAGTAAAVCAARLGMDVLLLEATGCLGGMGTSGLVCAFDPMADGERALVGGFQREVVERMYERGELGPQVTPDFWRKRFHCWTPFKVEGLKLILDEMTTEAGVDVRFFAQVVAVDCPERGRRVSGVVANDIEGLKYIPARMFIDCTGDAVLANLCGVECRTNPNFMPGTLCSLHAGIDWSRVKNQQGRLEQAIQDGFFAQPDRHLPGLSQVGEHVGYLNGGHLFKLDALTCAGRTEGMRLGRRLAREYLDFYRKYVDGCQDMELVATAPLPGIRESRRIVGEMELTFDDYISRRKFPDQIGLFNKFVDIHVRDCSDAEYARFQEEHTKTGILGIGESFGIPYGILVPRGSENLWVAGRCNSSDERVHGSIRVMPAAGMMGQAAGTAAAQALRLNQTASTLDTERLVTTLRDHNAYLPQTTLSREMTRK
ncbi:MAG: FAD-dependent oxidoreductase [Kiritimatiellia bacterium]